MAIFDFPSGLFPQLESASGCLFVREPLRAMAPGGRGLVQVIDNGSPGRWRQEAEFNLSFDQWREVEAVYYRLKGGIDQLRAPDFYAAADRLRTAYPANQPLASTTFSDAEEFNFSEAPTLAVAATQVAGATSFAVTQSSAYTGILLRKGARVAFGSRLHVLLEDLLSSTLTLVIEPGLRAGVVGGTLVETINPRGLWLIEEPPAVQFLPNGRRRVGLSLVEDLR